MILDSILTGMTLIVFFYLIFYVGKVVNDRLHKGYDLVEELVHKDNPAVALAVTGYYAGLVLAIGGALTGPSAGIGSDLMDLVLYGLLSIVLLNISWVICDKVMLHRFSVTDELVRDRNQGTGAVSFGVSVASGLVIHGAVSGEGGGILTALAFWVMGQLLLLLAAYFYNLILPYDLHAEIEKDNVAAGVSLGGALIAVGIVVGLAAEGDFHSWGEDFAGFIVISLVGILLLPVVRWLTDKVLLPTVKLTDEIANQDVPNVGAAYIEAFSYIAAAFLIYWCI